MVWAEENTRDALFGALRRRETYATSGNRPQLRFFGGFDYPPGLCSDPDLVRKGYAGGVPMGGELRAQGERAPVFVVAGRRDPVSGQPLARLEVVKGWIGADGQTHESVIDVARAKDAATLDTASCSPGETGGAEQLCARWQDNTRKPGETAWYYARLLETPSCRWSQKLCMAAGVRCDDPASIPEGYGSCCSSGHKPVIQERAWSSPIWVLPPAPSDA
jgi:Protein of unknown function (DUF3604)